MIHIGITGSREGMTYGQRQRVEALISDYSPRGQFANGAPILFHHGDCVGVDAQAHELASHWGLVTVAHPPTVSRLRAYCKADIIHYPKPYLQRNRDIVNAVQFLIVVPSGAEDQQARSGTWATKRMAEYAGIPFETVAPQ